MKRIIGRYGQGRKGPLLIAFGALHGNEESGVEAVKLLSKMLEVEPITNPDFVFRGAFIGILGNIQAYKKGLRFLDRDLNRMWQPKHVAKGQQKVHGLSAEYHEQAAIIATVKEEVKSYQPTEVVILDLHSTSSPGGIFTIPAKDKRSLELAHALHAPVITHMLDELTGTTLHYFSDKIVEGVKCTALSFEAGQHTDPLSINRCIAAIINCMKSMGCVSNEDVENIHDDILIRYSQPYPKQSRLIYKHDIKPVDQFRMRAGYENFQYVEKGEILARDRNGEIPAPESGLLLMPLYQKQGSEGFFIVEPVEEEVLINE